MWLATPTTARPANFVSLPQPPTTELKEKEAAEVKFEEQPGEAGRVGADTGRSQPVQAQNVSEPQELTLRNRPLVEATFAGPTPVLTVDPSAGPREDGLHDRRDQSEGGSVRRIVPGSAYEARNVYKSVVRYLVTNIKRNRDHMDKMLVREGFSEDEIAGALEEIGRFKDTQRPKDIERNSQARVERMLRTKSIFTYILRETLIIMLDKWRQGDYGQLSLANSSIYIAACKKFCERANKLLIDNKPALAGP